MIEKKLATAGTLDAIKKLIAEFYYTQPDNITLTDQGDHWAVQSGTKTVSTIVVQAGRRFVFGTRTVNLGDFAGEGKPIVITKLFRGWVLHVEGKPLMKNKETGKYFVATSAESEPAVIETLSKAEGFAHQIGRYKLKLGDFVDSYTQVIR